MTMGPTSLLLGLGSILSCLFAQAQTAPETWWVAFTDKEDTPYSLFDPGAFLSDRAIQRREAQGIGLDELDLPVDPAYIAIVLAQGEVQLINRSKWFNAITIRTSDQEALDAIAELPFVSGIRGTRSLVMPFPLLQEDKFTVLPGTGPRGGGNEEDYGASFHQIAMMNGHLLHAIGARGEGLLIGVLDSGFEGVDVLPAFETLRDRDGIILTRDFVDHDGDVYQDHWHGRSVLSCLGIEWTGILMGTAPLADYVLLRTEDVGSEYVIEEDNWVSAAEFCDSLGVDILNTSLGYTVFDDSTQNHTYPELDGATTRISIAGGIAASRGMIPVTSAGNQGASDWYHISAPADAFDILAVGATNADGQPSWFSGHGPSADGRIKPDVSAMGEGTMGLSIDGSGPEAINGTSFSAPLVAGLVACLWQLHPDRSALEIMEAVRRSASHYDAPETQLGHGIPDFIAAHAWLTLLSVDRVPHAGDLFIHPVPFTDHFTIHTTGSNGVVRVELISTQGARVLERQMATGPTIIVNGLGHLAPGPYLLRLWSNGMVMSRMVLKAW